MTVPTLIRWCTACNLPGHLWDDTDPLYPGCEGRCPGCIRRDINDDMRAVRREDR